MTHKAFHFGERVSSYCIVSKLNEDTHALLHGYTGAIDKIPSELGRWFIQNKSKKIQTFPQPYTDLVSHFKTQGYITKLSQHEEQQLVIDIAQILHDQEVDHSPTSFILIPSYTCNLRCNYCYQPHEMHAGKGRFDTLMTSDQVDWAFNIIKNINKKGSLSRFVRSGYSNLDLSQEKNLIDKVGLFGGEPLLKHNRKIIEYIYKKSIDNEIPIHAVTNGVDLESYSDLLGPKGIAFLQITLDGSPAIHNKRRVGPGQKETFKIIEQNISIALEKKCKVQVRVNTDESNIHELEKLNSIFNHNGWNKTPYFESYSAPIVDSERHSAKFDPFRLVNHTVNSDCVISSEERVAKSIVEACTSSNEYPFKSVSYCSAESGMLLFDCFGDVYTCWEEVGCQDDKVASFNEIGIQFDLEKIEGWLSRFPGAIQECSNCEYALIHTSGCAKQAKLQNNNNILSPACRSFQNYFPQLFAKTLNNIGNIDYYCANQELIPLVEI